MVKNYWKKLLLFVIIGLVIRIVIKFIYNKNKLTNEPDDEDESFFRKSENNDDNDETYSGKN